MCVCLYQVLLQANVYLYLDDKIKEKLQNLIAFLPVYLVLITVQLALRKKVTRIPLFGNP